MRKLVSRLERQLDGHGRQGKVDNQQHRRPAQNEPQGSGPESERQEQDSRCNHSLGAAKPDQGMTSNVSVLVS